MIINHCCVTNDKGNTLFEVTHNQTGSSHVSTSSQGTKIPNLVLDDYIEKKKIKLIEFMKMDIEGYELFALKGLSESLSKKLVQSIYFEVIHENLRRYDIQFDEILALFNTYEYTVCFCDKDDFNEKNPVYLFEGLNNKSINLQKITNVKNHVWKNNLLAIENSFFKQNSSLI